MLLKPFGNWYKCIKLWEYLYWFFKDIQNLSTCSSFHVHYLCFRNKMLYDRQCVHIMWPLDGWTKFRTTFCKKAKSSIKITRFLTEFIIFGTPQSRLPNLRLLAKFTYTHVSVLDPEILSTLTFPANKYAENAPAIKYGTRENNRVPSFFFYADCKRDSRRTKCPIVLRLYLFRGGSHKMYQRLIIFTGMRIPIKRFLFVKETIDVSRFDFRLGR